MANVSPRDYLTEALDLLAHNALNRDRVDWQRIRTEAFTAIAGATTTAQTHGEIQRAITALADPHTVFITPDVAAAAFGEQASQDAAMPGGELIVGEFALIRLPEASGIDEADERYVRTGAKLVRDLDANRPGGWIVDLRGNFGGNMFPMLTVVAPLLGDGHLGSFVDSDDTIVARWELKDGEITVEEQMQSPVANPYRLAVSDPPIAVLTDADTMSAGEATLIAFRGKENVRSFGAPTAGLATGNAAFSLPDGAMIALTMVREADRTGRRYGNEPIAPDEPADDALSAAISWLKSR